MNVGFFLGISDRNVTFEFSQKKTSPKDLGRSKRTFRSTRINPVELLPSIARFRFILAEQT